MFKRSLRIIPGILLMFDSWSQRALLKQVNPIVTYAPLILKLAALPVGFAFLEDMMMAMVEEV